MPLLIVFGGSYCLPANNAPVNVNALQAWQISAVVFTDTPPSSCCRLKLPTSLSLENV